MLSRPCATQALQYECIQEANLVLRTVYHIARDDEDGHHSKFFVMQFYFETIFPRIPKPVHDDFVSKLISMGLPSKAVRNGGQGGVDRRGVEEGNRRPASVKASL